MIGAGERDRGASPGRLSARCVRLPRAAKWSGRALPRRTGGVGGQRIGVALLREGGIGPPGEAIGLPEMAEGVIADQESVRGWCRRA